MNFYLFQNPEGLRGDGGHNTAAPHPLDLGALPNEVNFSTGGENDPVRNVLLTNCDGVGRAVVVCFEPPGELVVGILKR